jgi:peroxiredoxin
VTTGSADPLLGALGPGERAPDFELPAADREGTVALAELLRRGPVLLTLLRGLYCPFCRRHISQLRPACEALRLAGIAILGVVVASPELARRYFRAFPPCFPVAATPDRALHRAYGLPEVVRTPEFARESERRAADFLGQLGVASQPGQARSAFLAFDGYEMTPDDRAELRQLHQMVGYFLVGSDGIIRWARVDQWMVPMPDVEELRRRAL